MTKYIFHIIKYLIDTVKYISRIFYLCGKKHLEKVSLSSLVHHSCSYAHEFLMLLLGLKEREAGELLRAKHVLIILLS
jgi:hypothetical protein